MKKMLESVKNVILDVLQEYMDIEDVPPPVVEQAARDLVRMRVPLSRDVVNRYVQSMLLPELNRRLVEKLDVFRRAYGWGHIKRLLPYILSEYLQDTGYTVYVRPLVDSTRVDVVVERYGKYLPILISTGSKEKYIRYRASRLKSRGINVEIVTLTREKVLHDRANLVCIELVEYLVNERGHEHPNFIIDRYEQTFFRLWRDFSRRGYIVFRNYLYENYVFDLLMVGYSVIGVKKLTRNLIYSDELLKRNLKALRNLLRKRVVDKIKLVVLYDNLDVLVDKLRRLLAVRDSEYITLVEA